MAKGDVNFLMSALIFFFIYSLLVSLIVNHAIETGEFPPPPLPYAETGNFWTDSANGLSFMGEIVSYYFYIFFGFDSTIAIISTIFIIISIVVVYILVKDIIIPLLDVVIPDWL